MRNAIIMQGFNRLRGKAMARITRAINVRGYSDALASDDAVS